MERRFSSDGADRDRGATRPVRAGGDLRKSKKGVLPLYRTVMNAHLRRRQSCRPAHGLIGGQIGLGLDENRETLPPIYRDPKKATSPRVVAIPMKGVGALIRPDAL